MQILRMALVALVALALGFWLGGWHRPAGLMADRAPQAVRTTYTCSMHPQVIQDHPGDCPICGMTLTPVSAAPQGATDGTNAASDAILIDPVTIQNMGVRTDRVTQGPLRRVIRTVATVEYDETTLADVTTKFRGWVTRLWVNATGQVVHRGDPLFEFYAPELYDAQAEYLVALRAAAADPGRSVGPWSNALNRLRLLDISDSQIADIEKTGLICKTLRFDAPRDGIVVEKPIVEGQMVEAGMRLYRIADLGRVWVRAQVFEQDAPLLRVGQEAQVTLDYLPDRVFRGRVTFVYPTIDERTRTVPVRMAFYNPGYFLKPGMFATAELRAELAADAVLVPESAVLRSGARNTVFVAQEGGRFEPRAVTLGLRDAENRYQVLAGLAAGERIVTSGQFLLDSESQLRASIQKMRPPAEAETTPVAASVRPPANDAPAAYVCPMPEHVAIAYRLPGTCSLCGMALVPVTAAQLAQFQPGTNAPAYAPRP